MSDYLALLHFEGELVLVPYGESWTDGFINSSGDLYFYSSGVSNRSDEGDSKFGDGAAYSNSDTGYIYATGVQDISIDNYTVDFWFKAHETEANDEFLGLWGLYSGSTNNTFGTWVDRTSGVLVVDRFEDGTQVTHWRTNWEPTKDEYHHLAFVRSSGQQHIYADGTHLGQFDCSSWTSIGNENYLSILRAIADQSYYSYAYVDEYRTLTNSALEDGKDKLYISGSPTEGFSVPTEAYKAEDEETSPSGNNGVDEYTKLLLHADGDLSDSHHNLTYKGGVKFDYVATPVGNGAYYFDGTNDYIEIPDSDDWNFGSSDFCIEAWVKADDIIGFRVWQQEQDFDNRHGLVYESTYGLSYLVRQDETAIIWAKGTFSPVVDTWYHVAVTRSGNTFRIFVDGSDVTYEGGSNSSTIPNFSGSCYVGARSGAGIWTNLNGNISDLRITKGDARYTSNFTPPTERLAADASTVLLLSGSGDYGTTGHSIATYNGVKESSDNYKFGSGAFYFDGSNDYLSVPDSDDWNFGSGDFTIDCWLKRTSTGAVQPIISQRDGPTDYPFWFVRFNSNDKLYLHSRDASNFHEIWEENTATIADTTIWHHIAFVRNSGIVTLYVDGTSSPISTSFTLNHQWADSNTSLNIGKEYTTDLFQGYIDELRISKGIARWTSDFDVPTKEYGSPPYSENFQFELIDTDIEFDFDLATEKTNNLNLYTQGMIPQSGNVNIYSRGYDYASGDFNIYSRGHDSLNIYSWGYVEDSGNFSLFTHGSLPASGFFDIYSRGFEAFSLFTMGTKAGSLYYGEENSSLNILTSGINGIFETNEFNIYASSSPPIEISGSFPLFTPREIISYNTSLPIVCNSVPPEYANGNFNIYANGSYSNGVMGYLYGGFSMFTYAYYSRTPRIIVPDEEPAEETEGSGAYNIPIFAIGI